MKNALWLWFTGQESFSTERTLGHTQYLNSAQSAGSVVPLNFKCQPHISSCINPFLHLAADSG